MRLQYVLAGFLFLTALAAPLQSQSLDSDTGRLPFGSYFDADIDSINVYNGNLLLDIPLFTLPGREISTGLRLTYNSQKWQWVDLVGWPVGLYSGGWRIHDPIGEPPIFNTIWLGCQWPNDVWQVVANWIDGFGTKHVYSTVVLTPEECGFGTPPSANNLVLDSANGDGSQMRTGESAADTIVTFKDGTSIHFTANPSVRTRNGNFVTRLANGAPGPDTLGRTIQFETNKGQSSEEYFKKFSIKDSNGQWQTYELKYDDSYTVWNPMFQQEETRGDRLVEIVLPNGRSYKFQYEHAQGYLTRVELPSGGSIDYDYPQNQLAVNSDYIVGRNVRFDGTNVQTWNYTRSSDNPARDVTVTSPEGNTVVHRFDAQGREFETQWRTSAGNLEQTVEITRYPNGSPQVVTTRVAGFRKSTSFSYDFMGSVTIQEETDWGLGGPGPLLRRTQFWYHNFTDPFPFQRIMAREVSGIHPLTGQWQSQAGAEFTYDQFALTPTPPDVPNKGSSSGIRGNLTTLRSYFGPSGEFVQETFEYDDLGNLLKHRDPMGHETAISYSDNFTSDPDPVNTFAYPTLERNAAGHETRTVYDFHTGLPKQVRNARNLSTFFSYDGFNRLTSVTAPNGLVTEYTYDDDQTPSMVERAAVLEGSGAERRIETFFDRFYRPIAAVYKDPSGDVVVDTEYDGEGRVKRVSQPRRSWESAAWTTTTYDSLGRPTVITNPDGTTQNRAYFFGHEIFQTDEAGNQQWLVFNGLGQLTQVWELDPNEVWLGAYYSYYSSGLLGKVHQYGQERTFVHDGLGRLVSETHPESGTTTYEVDGDGRVTFRTDARGITTAYGYDAIDRLLSVTYSDGTPPVGYTYDESGFTGLLTKVTDGSGWTRFSYNTVDLLTAEERKFTGAAGTFVTQYGYYKDGQLQSVRHPSGRVVTYERASAGGLVTDRLSRIDDGATGAALHHTIAYNAAGQVTSRKLGSAGIVQENFGFNVRNQLTGITASANSSNLVQLSYGYGEQNNGRIRSRTDWLHPEHSVEYAYDSLQRLQQVQAADSSWGITWSFDAWGNRTSQTPWGVALGAQTMGYVNNRNTLFSYDDAGNVTADGNHTYSYDAENRIRQVDGGAVQYAYDSQGRRVRKTTSSGATFYIYGLTGLLSEFTTVNTGATQAGSNNRLDYRVSEQTGTGILVLSADGSIIEHNRVLPYGELWTQNPGSTNEEKFTTYLRDSETGIDYAVARYYASLYGRFMTPDPGHIGGDPANPQSWNAYGYGLNDPVNLTDPQGLLAAPLPPLPLPPLPPCTPIDVDGFAGGTTPGCPGEGPSIVDVLRETIVKAIEIITQPRDPACMARMTTTHAVVGGIVGGVMGAVGGGAGGAVGGTFVAPGVGTVGGGFGGGAGGFAAGAAYGTAAGATVGGAVGWASCMSSAGGGTGTGNGSKKVTFGHGGRHLAGTGLSQSEVENAIRADVQEIANTSSATGNFWGKIVLHGRQIFYRAFTLPDGTINVGTYTVGAP